MTLYVFGEGKTERKLMRQLVSHERPDLAMDFRASNGKGTLVETVINTLGPELVQPIRCVILVDRDNGDTFDSIRDRYEQGFQRLLDERGFTSTASFRALPEWENVLTLALNPPDLPDLRVALHIARIPVPLQEYNFNSDTTDGYILAAALIESVRERFARKAGIDSQGLFDKVTCEIPDLMRKNGVEHFDAKDLIAAYMAAARFLKVKRSEREDTFAGIVVARLIKHAPQDFDRIFSSIVAAINAVTPEGEGA